MELHKIKPLLKKYLEAETTLKEEQALQAYFSSSQVDPSLEAYRSLFAFYTQEKKVVLTNEERVISLPRKRNNHKLFASMASVAALLVIAISVFQFANTPKHNVIEGNHELAMKNTQGLLNMVTGAVANGKENLMYLKELPQTKSRLINTK